MKKITMFVAAAMLMTAGVLSSCSSSKNVTSTAAGLNEERIAVAETKSQKLAAAKPDVRSSGIGNHFNQAFALMYAENTARAEFARKLGTMVQTAARQSTDGADKFHSDGVNSSVGTDQGILSNAFAQSVAEGLVSNTVVINKDIFKRKDGQFEVEVCIEYIGTVEALKTRLVDEFDKKVKQQVSDEEIIRMKYEQEKFKQSIEDQLNMLRNSAQ